MGINTQLGINIYRNQYITNDFWEWLFKEVEVRDTSHLYKKFDQHYMTTPVFIVWFKKLLKEY
jgi:hypothetical protein